MPGWPPGPRDGTLVAARIPRTVVPGAVRSYPLGSTGLAGLVGGLSTRATGPVGADWATVPIGGTAGPAPAGRPLAPGDVVVLTLPDSSVAGTATSRVLVTGPARVTVLGGDGAVLVDTAVGEHQADAVGLVDRSGTAGAAVRVPAGAALVSVQADGTTDPDGLAGWHVRSRVCALGSHAALAAGCVLRSDGRPSSQGVRWITAAELLAGAAAVVTRFSRPVRTVAVVVEAAEPDRVDGLGLELSGARRVAGPDGADLPPTVVLSGGQAVLLFAVEPEPAGPVSVRVRAGGDWQVTGILGGDLSPAEVASVVVRLGVATAAGRLLAATGTGCTVSWSDQGGPR